MRGLVMRALLLAVVAATISVPADARTMDRSTALPSESSAKDILNSPLRHREWVSLPTGSGLAFVVYPRRADQAPAVIVTETADSSASWIRAVADQLAAEGYIAVLPAQVADADAARAYAVSRPSADGRSLRVTVDRQGQQLRAGSATFALTDDGWRDAVAYLNTQAHNDPVTTGPSQQDEHAGHHAMMAMTADAPQSSRSEQPTQMPWAEKRPDLPANYYTAKAALAQSTLRKEWVEIPLGEVKLRAWVEYPEGNGKAGVVIVMHHGVGMDDAMRSIADQLAREGFIAVAPDTWSGTGPNGGGRDSFEFEDDAMRAAARITPQEAHRRYKAAWEWAMRLPRASGKSASLGFCAGGVASFSFAGEVPELNAAVVFYGGPPPEQIMAKINAPVLGLYGDNDPRVTSTIEPTKAAMKKLGKRYEPHIYTNATHAFVNFQHIGANFEALQDAWPRAMAFLKQNLQTTP